VARKDRTFTAKDVWRIYCNNLDPYERAIARGLIAFGSCTTENTCERLQAVLRIAEPVCTIYGVGLGRFLRKVPYIGKYLDALVKLACALTDLVSVAYDFFCVEGGDNGAKVDAISEIGSTIGELKDAAKRSKIALGFGENSRIQKNSEEYQEIIEYLGSSTYQITIF